MLSDLSWFFGIFRALRHVSILESHSMLAMLLWLCSLYRHGGVIRYQSIGTIIFKIWSLVFGDVLSPKPDGASPCKLVAWFHRIVASGGMKRCENLNYQGFANVCWWSLLNETARFRSSTFARKTELVGNRNLHILKSPPFLTQCFLTSHETRYLFEEWKRFFVTQQYNDVTLMTYLGVMSKGSQTLNQFITKFNVLFDRQSAGRRMRGVFL